MITVKLLEIDRPTGLGRTYPKNVIEAALKDWKEHFKTDAMPIFKEATATPKVEDIVGYASNFKIEDGFLMADIGFKEDRIKELFPEETASFAIRPNGSGVTDENGIIQEGYKMVGLCVRKPNTESKSNEKK